MARSFLHDLMNPRSIAIVGASNNPAKMGTLHALSILKDGFTGKLYPVHPTEETVLGLPAWKDPADLPEAPDLAMFVLPAKYLLPIFEAFGKRGTRHAIVITAGFKETGDDGADLEQQLVDIARKYGMRFIGPNCMGLFNLEAGLNTSVAPITGEPGKLALISQSGTYVAQTVDYLYRRGIRLGKAVSVGNEADVTLVDVLEYLGEDEGTTAISLYIESIREPRRFLEVARRITPHKPVLAQYIGGTEAGGRAGGSHTGAMAGNDRLYDALFRQAGVLRVDTIERLYAEGWALATTPPIQGRRIGIVTNSGGPGSAIADTLDRCKCEVPPFSGKLVDKIRPLVPPHAPAGNPVDLTFSLDLAVMSETIPDLVMKSGEVDGVILHGAFSTGFYSLIYPHLADLVGMSQEDFLAASSSDMGKSMDLQSENRMPLVISSFFGREDNYSAAYMDAGIPVFDAPEKAARGMATLVAHYDVRSRSPYKAPALPEVREEAVDIITGAVARGRQALDEYEAKRVLAAYGLPTSREMRVDSRDAAVAAAEKIGFPVVIKACDAEILHKTDRGLVQVNLADADAVAVAVDAIREGAGRPVPILVAEMVSARRELLAGIVRDEGFGHCVAFGVGGVLTEALDDVVYRLAPVNREEAGEMIGEVGSRKLLEACRGMGTVDRDALVDLLTGLGALPTLHPEIQEIDLNPVLIRQGRPVAVDAVILLR
jgi:acyl-CoA synthetase (NDP forming)